MSEYQQSRRLQEAELTPGPELWARLEGRLAAPALAERPNRRALVWYLATAASVLLALGFLIGLRPQAPLPEPAPLAIRQAAPACAPLPSTSPLHLALAAVDARPAAACTDKPQAQSVAYASRPGRKTAKPQANPQADCQQTPAATPCEVVATVEIDTQTVAGYNAPHQVLAPIDSMPVLSPFVSPKDSLSLMLASVAPGGNQTRQARDTARGHRSRQSQRETLINKLNRALRWLPGGNAWPTIRFEKAEVAIAFHARPKPEAEEPN